MLMLGIADGELGAVAGSVANGDLGDITIGDKLRLATCNGRLDGVSDRCGLSCR